MLKEFLASNNTVIITGRNMANLEKTNKIHNYLLILV